MQRSPLLLVLAWAALSACAAETLDIHFVDVEGGQATLIVTPAGESLLVDAGWPGFGGRDSARIARAAQQAGIRRIDYLLTTHYHLDHVGGVPEIAARFPVVHFVDHGPNTESGRQADQLSEQYRRGTDKAKRLVVRPGDVIPLKGVKVDVVTARGERLATPIAGAGAANPLCAAQQPKHEDPSENARSVGFLLTYGKFRFIDLGDLTWNKELELVCPLNLIGTVDAYLTSHHGLDMSGPAAIVHALRPRVAIMNNGARKGGAPSAWRVVRNSPGLDDLWQLHHALAGGRETNSPPDFVANLEEQCQGHGIKLSARDDGSFAVTNERTGYSKSYPRRP